jgi:hypothetical protein
LGALTAHRTAQEPSSRGCGPDEPLVSYQIHRKFPVWNLHPLAAGEVIKPVDGQYFASEYRPYRTSKLSRVRRGTAEFFTCSVVLYASIQLTA